jgi:hypothetical protein
MRSLLTAVVVLAFAIVLGTTQGVYAFPLDPSGTVTISDGPGNGVGGAFFAEQGSTKFATFCLEYNEGIGFGTTYDISIDTGAVKGGVPEMFDPLSNETQWLYWAFFEGFLSSEYATAYAPGSTWNGSTSGFDVSYPGTDTQRADNSALQEAIWILENEIAGPGSTTTENLISLATAKVAASGVPDVVRVMNTWTVGHEDELPYAQQSQLTTIIPEAASIIGWGLIACVFGCSYPICRRWRRKSS